MQLKRWLRFDEKDRASRRQSTLSGLCFATALAISLGLALSGCENGRSYQRTADGPIEYLDQIPEAQKVAARDRIAQTLNQGLKDYKLQIGDEFEIFYAVARHAAKRRYVISPRDKLRVDFLAEAENNREVLVRPDGRISVPLLGPVMAAGKTADALARDLERQYAG